MSLTTLNASATGNTVEYNLNTNQGQEVYGTTYFHTIFSGSGAKTLRAATTVNGNLAISGAAILDVSASNYLLNIKGNWTNSSLPGSSLAPFNARTGTVTFTGNAPQTITSSAYAGGNSFYNLTFNNTATSIPQILIANDDNATGTLTLTAGNIDLGSTTFTLGFSSTVKGTLVHTAGYFLNGTFKRWFNTTAVTLGNVAGRFPIGHKENATTVRDRSVYLGGTAIIGGTMQARHANATGNFDFVAPFQDNGTIVDVRHNMSWITAVGDGLDGSAFQLRISAEGMPGVNNAAMLRIVKQNGAAPGTSISGGGTTSNPYANKQGMGPSGMNNTFYMGSSWNTNPLPITLLSFTAVPDGNRVKLDWVTASEENNDFFTIEKSKNGVDFVEVLQKAGAGNSNTNIAYNDFDNDPYAGTSYYRLKQTDYNGQFKYSNMVAVEFATVDQDIEFNIFPNPASSSFGDVVQFTMNTEDMDEQPVVINVLDMSGRIVATVNQRTNRSILQAEVVQSSNLKPGMYTVVAVIGKKQITKKLIIN
ncbi:MAG: T9SS type A sorting domain-containing protein [Sphingobacteriales bacterium JAD_PAG50586_3]|nr:MAG: T9SS type A sorting domain-containing protein [Sphingobacteriales bacterium JAD_PAG50586_3]